MKVRFIRNKENKDAIDKPGTDLQSPGDGTMKKYLITHTHSFKQESKTTYVNAFVVHPTTHPSVHHINQLVAELKANFPDLTDEQIEIRTVFAPKHMVGTPVAHALVAHNSHTQRSVETWQTLERHPNEIVL